MNTWRHFKLRFAHLPQPQWWLDIYLIDTTFRNVISVHVDDFILWRFHRRSAPDQSGHQLSFLCYIDESLVPQIENKIFSHSSITFLENEGLLLNKLNDTPGPQIEDTSDPSWPIEVQKSWPYYIKGVSEMLIDLIEQLKQTGPTQTGNDLRGAEAYYSSLNDRMNSLWLKEGSHAFLHHLNALFGYSPVTIIPRRINGMDIVF